MNSLQTTRFFAISIALFSMLFMQIAAASYVCPGSRTSNHSSVSSPSRSSVIDYVVMSGCDGMDANQPGLCHMQGKGNVAKQSVVKMQFADVAPFNAAGLIAILLQIDISSAGPVDDLSAKLSGRISAPALSILHCCFRI